MPFSMLGSSLRRVDCGSHSEWERSGSRLIAAPHVTLWILSSFGIGRRAADMSDAARGGQTRPGRRAEYHRPFSIGFQSRPGRVASGWVGVGYWAGLH